MRRKFNTAVLFSSIALLIIFFSFFFFAKLYKRRRIEKNSLVSRLLPRGIYCSLSSICHLKRTVWVNRPSTSFRQVTLESKGAPRRVKSSENSEWIAKKQSRFFAPSVPCSDPLTMIPWILNEFRVSLLDSRYRAFFYGREKIREDARKGRNVLEGTVAIRWNDYTRSHPDATTFKI